MNQMQKSSNQWIGVINGWQSISDNPLDHLISLPPSRLKTHALLIGATGCGKTNLLHHLIAQDIERGHSIAILDLRGDLVGAALQICCGRVRPNLVKIIDLRERNRPFGFNPLSGAGEPYFRALNLLEVLEHESDSWGVQLAETLRNGLLLLAEIDLPITSLEKLLYDATFRLACLSQASASPVTEFWVRYHYLSADKQATLAMPVLNKLSLLLSTKTLRTTLGHSDPIDLGDQLNTPGSVTLISLAADELHGAGKMMGSLILASICREIFSRVPIPEKQRNPVRLYVDEFEHFVLGDFETILAEGRRFGFSVVLAHQTLAQLSPRMRSMILNNVGVKFAFRCGREDSSTICRDLTGDPQAYDLNTLKTGIALLWVRGQKEFLIEINEPLFRNVGLIDEATRAYINEIYKYAPRSCGSDENSYRQVPPTVLTIETADRNSTQATLSLPRSQKTPKKAISRMEDWLCG